eukprot:gnl/TRDRNA2_/TRDRNA2_197514_c0_seq1.p1 gnl/TRDRNA2_/TRDRNA2_197514_c0~~gnl/TRDRNA2_/TRDRNA2_197514_c0_seq1.p1  ORF type:complete len:429 (-),score=77.43 gnl/TRDRNA2_/TRDRNA2_197514_c0_seq1:52-1338(-)
MAPAAAAAKRKGKVQLAPGGSKSSRDDDDMLELLPDKASSSFSNNVLRLAFAGAAVASSVIFFRPWNDGQPYAFMTSAVHEATLRRAEDLAGRVIARGEASASGQKREFGTGQNYLSQHSVTFLHGPASDPGSLAEVVDDLRRVAQAAARKKGWALSNRRLVPRCVELITYTSSLEDRDSNVSQSLGWHDDGATQLTVAALLTSSSDYGGGGIELKRADGSVITLPNRPTRGDAVVWRGWDRHRVLPVTAGERRVVVAEFWSERTGSAKAIEGDRPLDDIGRYRDALALDPTASALHAGLGVVAAKTDDAELAEQSFRRAVTLDPLDASSLTGLGAVLLQRGRLAAALGFAGLNSGSSPQSAEAESVLRAAIALEPAGAESYHNLALVLERSGRKSEAELSREAALKLDPGLLKKHQQGASLSTQLHS